MEPDFSGYATKADIVCSDGRTITDTAFAHQDKIEVPLVWSHQHDGPENILGKAILEHRGADHPDGAGIYCYGYFNPDVERGRISKALVHNKDIKALSIYASGLTEKIRGKAKEVLHGFIQEVSLVISGANPGAMIDNITLAHGNGEKEVLDEAYIYTGLEIELPSFLEEQAGSVAHSGTDAEETGSTGSEAEEIYETLNEDQKTLVHSMIGAAIEQTTESLQSGGSAQHSGTETGGTLSADGTSTDGNPTTGAEGASTEGDLAHQEGSTMTRNVFDRTDGDGTMTGQDTSHRLTHSQLVDIVDNAKKLGSFKEALLAHADTYGINNLDMLFPDARAITETPQFISRRMEWVSKVINGTKHTPFAKVKTILADITGPEARAKGYITGTRKEEEVFGLLKRTTGPGTIYKMQKLDRDDMIDVTEYDVVNWLKAEMRLMTEEELARAILVGDGRSNAHRHKVKDPAGALDGNGIRSILKDDDLYALKKELATNVSPRDSVKEIVRAMDDYRGSGVPTMFIARKELTELLLQDDKFERPLYPTKQALADKLGVGDIVPVDIFSEYENLYAIIVSLSDYNIGTNRGGELTSFEDFDIDFNQYKYLMETRLSGGLVKPFSAVVVTKRSGTLATVTQPSYNGETGVVTIPSATGVTYLLNGDEATAGAQEPITEPAYVEARPDAGYYFATGTTREWTYAPPA